ncbi:MAG: hypothetical protein SF069_01970 [Phycisphaerae bacterium]|nr:hypothetical protein [Phycisphaerae bacterium]
MQRSKMRGFTCGVGGLMSVFVLGGGVPALGQAPQDALIDPVAATNVTLDAPAPPETPSPVSIPVVKSGTPTVPLAPILDANSAQFSFQARLTDNGGNPLPGPTADLTFQLYSGGGAALGAPIALNAVPLADGIVDVLVPFSPSNFDGTARQIGVRVNGGAELTPRLPVGSVPYAYRVDRVASAELDDAIELGEAGVAGYLAIFGGGPVPRFAFDAAMGIASLVNDDNSGAVSQFANAGGGYVTTMQNGEINAYLDGATGQIWSENSISVGDINNNLVNTVHARMSSHGWGGWMQMWDEGGDTAIRMGASSSTSEGGYMEMYRAAGGVSLFLDAEDGSGNGLLQVRNAVNTALELNGAQSRLLTFGTNGDEYTRLGGTTSGNLQLRGGGVSNPLTVNLLGAGTGGQLDLYRTTGQLGARMSGGTSTTGGAVIVFNEASQQTIDLNGDESSGGGSITLRDGASDRLMLDADTNRMQFFAGAIESLRISGNGGDNASVIDMRNSAEITTIELDADESDKGIIRVRSATGGGGVTLDGGETSGAGGQMLVYNTAGDNTVEIDGDNGSGNSFLSLRRAGGATAIGMSSSEGGNGADISLYNAAGQLAIQIDTNFNNGANSRIIVDELQIAGGSDLSEQFDIASASSEPQPGMVVCIDPANPGKLIVSSKANDRTVAGIISGAGGVKPGMYMGQAGTAADGKSPVALTGRVYCFVDASNGAIQPGDLLTTSATPGHAMKVSDHSAAQGAIIGKAMSSLESGQGLVLVLVNLQ